MLAAPKGQRIAEVGVELVREVERGQPFVALQIEWIQDSRRLVHGVGVEDGRVHIQRLRPGVIDFVSQSASGALG